MSLRFYPSIYARLPLLATPTWHWATKTDGTDGNGSFLSSLPLYLGEHAYFPSPSPSTILVSSKSSSGLGPLLPLQSFLNEVLIFELEASPLCDDSDRKECILVGASLYSELSSLTSIAWVSSSEVNSTMIRITVKFTPGFSAVRVPYASVAVLHGHQVKQVDCYTITVQELESVTSRYRFTSMMRAPLHGFAFWFDVEFSGPSVSPSNNYEQSTISSSVSPNLHLPPSSSQTRKRTKSNESLVLSTAPEDPPTHWQQTLLYFYEPIEVNQDQVIEGSITLSQSKENARFLNIHLEYTSGGRSYVKESVMR
ncbi:hypothetical protein GIB67_003562 [Kingdonia uniflora]|uniref:Protein arginine N-methyltransferase domain-containing protein n=1 Tax=Kingdonia uniflora TaxID=39325 RepID=A0A7J7MEY8_9MAGN|nr:hypothetical protein GIB67_003562 [Kingdonia uniflora]